MIRANVQAAFGFYDERLSRTGSRPNFAQQHEAPLLLRVSGEDRIRSFVIMKLICLT